MIVECGTRLAEQDECGENDQHGNNADSGFQCKDVREVQGAHGEEDQGGHNNQKDGREPARAVTERGGCDGKKSTTIKGVYSKMRDASVNLA